MKTTQNKNSSLTRPRSPHSHSLRLLQCSCVIFSLLGLGFIWVELYWMMASSSSDPGLKHEVGSSSGCGGGGESSEAVIANDQLLLYRGLKKAKKERGCTAKERISRMPPCTAGKRSSIYRGVTRSVFNIHLLFIYVIFCNYTCMFRGK